VPRLQPHPLLRGASPHGQRGALSATAEDLYLHIDGASRGNPGEAAFGVHVTGPAGEEVASLYGYLGRASNNVAEYEALLHALRYALKHGARRVRIFSDSELVVKQMAGQYRVKHPDMQSLHRQAQDLRRRFEHVDIAHVRRAQNKDADRLANQALDEKASKLD
jgi:ribonuclease HI